MKKALPAGFRAWLPLALVLLLAAYLRMTGLNWGIPTSGLRHFPFHPDEAWAMDVLGEIDLSLQRFNPPSAHREGTLTFYIWTAVAWIAKAVGHVGHMPSDLSGYGADYRRLMHLIRLVPATFGTFSVFLVYLIIKRITDSRASAVLGALVLAVMPFSVIYAHYIRSHIMSNTFVLASVYFSLFLYAREDKAILSGVGLSAGLAAASRYTSGACLLIPVLILAIKRLPAEGHWTERIRAMLTPQLAGRWLLLGAFFLAGFFMADPYLFLDFPSALPAIKFVGQFVQAEEFSLGQLLNLSRMWAFVSYLIPYGTLPFLWLLLYAGVLWAVYRRERWKATLPLLAFALFSLYAMAKGYTSTAIFIRPALMILPVLAILAGIAMGDMLRLTRSRRWLQGIFVAAVVFIIGSTIVYDVAYVGAMARDDARLQLHRFLAKELPEQQVTIGYMDRGHGYFLVEPTLRLVRNKEIAYIRDSAKLREIVAGRDTTPLDYLILSSFEAHDFPTNRAQLQELTRGGRWELVRTLENPIRALGITFRYPNPPHDLQYPFPVLHVLRHVKDAPVPSG